MMRDPWRIVAAACAVVLAVLVVRGLDAPLGQGDEVIYAENIREMRASGDWGVLTYQGEPGLLRPATPFVPVAIVSGWVDGELGLRLVPALLCLVILGLVFATAHRAWRRIDVALVATLVCASAPTFFLFARSLMSDPALVAATTFALYATVRAQDDPRWIVGAAAGLGAGVACKSLAAGVPGVALAPWLVVAIVRHRPWRIVGIAAAVFVAFAAPYFVYSYARFGEQFLDDHIGLSLGKRAGGTTQVGMDGGVLAYAFHVVRNDGPLTAAWLVAGVAGGGVLAYRAGDRALGVCVTYAIVVFALLSIVGTRLAHYLLPMYPAAALCAAGALAHVGPRLAALRPPLRVALAAAATVSVLLAGLARPLDHLFIPAPQAVELGRAATAAVPEGEPVYSLDWYAPALGYYAERDWHMLSTSADVAAYLQGVYLFRLAGNIHEVPPWPAPPFVVAGERERLAAAGFDVSTVIAEWGTFVLVEAR